MSAAMAGPMEVAGLELAPALVCSCLPIDNDINERMHS